MTKLEKHTLSTSFESAFREFVASSQIDQGGILFQVAMNGKKHEERITDRYEQALMKNLDGGLRVYREYRRSIYKHDLVVTDSSGNLRVVLEAKCPMTNHDGVRNKTRKPEHLPKDASAVRSAMGDGAVLGYELVVLIECYGLGTDGQPEPANGRSIMQYEKDARKKFGIQWQTRYDYSYVKGREEVSNVMKDLGLAHIKAWKRFRLPQPSGKRDVEAFLDCALFIA
jgi:hypothetical protein